MTTDPAPPANRKDARSLVQTPRRGVLLAVSAPSGAGKSTLLAWLTSQRPDIAYSISCTTRAPRGAEKNGVHYHFMSREEFLALRDSGGLVEWAEVHGNFYGTPKAPIQEHQAAGRDVLFDVDVQGAASLRACFPEAVLVFIFPPSRAELERRLAGRGTDAPEVITRRIENALGEIRRADEFDFWIVNDHLDTAREELMAVYCAAGLRPTSRPGLTETLLAQWTTDGETSGDRPTRRNA